MRIVRTDKSPPSSRQPVALAPSLVSVSGFRLTGPEEQNLINHLVGVRHVLRRADREGYNADDVLAAYSKSLADWPARRRAAALAAVLAGIDDADAAGAVFGWSGPALGSGDRVGAEGAA